MMMMFPRPKITTKIVIYPRLKHSGNVIILGVTFGQETGNMM